MVYSKPVASYTVTFTSYVSFYDQKVGNNEQQMQAVHNIVLGTSRSNPYLVFSPPGTGKTVTIVEAIKQVKFKIVYLKYALL